jgi:acyl-coenzyme A synthetase/AMP-(fatty) acid ligase
MDRLDVVEWAALIRDYRPRRAGAPPAVLRMVLDAEIPREWFASLKSFFTASAPLSMDLADEFEQVYGVPIIQGYGATEFLGRVTGWSDDLHEQWGATKRGSVGKAYPGVRLRVVERSSGEELGPNIVGNLEVETPWRARGIPAGWVATNDLARIDEDGFVWIVGRSDDVIIRGGFKIHLPDVEAALLDHAGVVDAVVIGLPDERLGAVPAALVVTNRTEPPDEEELLETLRQRLPGYMLPILVLRHEVMPYNDMLKKDRRVISDMLTAERAAREQLAV